MTLSDSLRDLADEIEDTDIDDDRAAHVSFRMDYEASKDTDIPIDQADDLYQGTVQCSISLPLTDNPAGGSSG